MSHFYCDNAAFRLNHRSCCVPLLTQGPACSQHAADGGSAGGGDGIGGGYRPGPITACRRPGTGQAELGQVELGSADRGCTPNGHAATGSPGSGLTAAPGARRGRAHPRPGPPGLSARRPDASRHARHAGPATGHCTAVARSATRPGTHRTTAETRPRHEPHSRAAAARSATRPGTHRTTAETRPRREPHSRAASAPAAAAAGAAHAGQPALWLSSSSGRAGRNGS
jgi:hypothetical protein